MSKYILCPKCGYELEVIAEFEEHERLVAEIVGGQVTEAGTALHDVIGPDGITYQVKGTSSIKHRKRRGSDEWSWSFHHGKNIESDFCVCFARYNGFKFMFLIDRDSGNKHMQESSRDSKQLRSHMSNEGWIWNFYVTRDTFMEKRNSLLAARQLSFEIENR